jgi:uncharacterized protein (DUF433 family)
MTLYKKTGRVVVNRKILAGKPIIKGTRISVELILKLLAQGVAIDEILNEYPRLTRADILVAIDYARELARNEEVYSLQFSGV